MTNDVDSRFYATRLQMAEQRGFMIERLMKHEKECETRYGEIIAVMREIKVNSERNYKLLFRLASAIIGLIVGGFAVEFI